MKYKITSSQKNINKNNSQQNIDKLLLNIYKYNLYSPYIGIFYEKSKTNPYLNFSTLEPIL